MGSLIRITFLQWRRSPGRIALALYPMFGVVFGVIITFLAGQEMQFNSEVLKVAPIVAIFYTILFGAGIISREREDGVLASVLARPLYRSTYVFSKWIALATASFLGALAFIIMHSLIIFSAMHQINLTDVLVACVETGLTCLGLSATLIAFSTIAPTYGDLFLYGFAWLGLSMYSMLVETINSSVGEMAFVFRPEDMDALMTFQHVLYSFLFPRFDLFTPLHDWPSMVLTFTSNLLGALLMSIFFLNRKEISYGG